MRGRPRKEDTPPWPPEKVAIIRTHWDNGAHLDEVAALFDTTYGAVYGVVRRNKFPRRKRAAHNKLSPEERLARVRRYKRNYTARRRLKAQVDPDLKAKLRAKARRGYETRKARIASDPIYRAHRRLVVELWRMRNADSIRESNRERDRTRAPRTHRPDHRKKGGSPMKPYIPKIEAVPDTAVTFLELGPHHCRWVLGEPNGMETTYCGAMVHDRSYCLKHYRLAYIPTPYRRNEAA